MQWLTVILAAAFMLALAAAMTWILQRAWRAWAVHEDPRVVAVEEMLAGLDCGQCGYPTCNDYAHAILEKGDPINKCRPGGKRTAEALANLLDIEMPVVGSHLAVVHCGASHEQRLQKKDYRGEPTCGAADVLSTMQGCTYGCLGLGDCERSCPFDAIHVIDGLAVVDASKCTACGNCVRACPRDIITVEDFKSRPMLVVACCNHDPGKDTRSVCEVGCIACGICEKTCELFTVRRNLSYVDYESYDPDAHGPALREASEKCPTGCLPLRAESTHHNSTPNSRSSHP
jgi:Na+-translocating ferredoxin:NAD+ oxidoreductase RNF subunit RnfB